MKLKDLSVCVLRIVGDGPLTPEVEEGWPEVVLSALIVLTKFDEWRGCRGV